MVKKRRKMPAANQGIKLGTRAERMAAYHKVEKTSGQKNREMIQEAKMAQEAGKSFDQASFALKKLGEKKAPSTRFVRGLVKKRLLRGDSVIRLYISGSLTQKLFQKVATSKEFKTKFGNSYIDMLAVGLSFIGPRGKQAARARKAFQGEKGKQLFNFLERRGFIKTHGKRNIVTDFAII